MKRITQTPNHIPHVKNMTVLSITVIINYKPALQNSRILKHVFVLRFLQPVFYVQMLGLGLAMSYNEAVQILVHPEINIFRENEQQVWNSIYNSHSGNNGRTADSSAIQWEGVIWARICRRDM